MLKAKCLRGTRRACFAVRGSPGKASRVALLSSVFLRSSKPSSDSSSPLVHFATASRASFRSFSTEIQAAPRRPRGPGRCFKSAAYSRAPKKRLEQRLIEQSFDQGRFIEQHDERLATSSASCVERRRRETALAMRGLSHHRRHQIKSFHTESTSKHAANCLSNNASSASRVAA